MSKDNGGNGSGGNGGKPPAIPGELWGKNVTDHNKDWQANHNIIQAAFLRHIQKNTKKPTTQQLAVSTGLSINTIDRHIKDLKFSESKSVFKILNDTIIISLARECIKGKVDAMKLWFQVINGWTEKQAMHHTGQVDFRQLVDKLEGTDDPDEKAKSLARILFVHNRQDKFNMSN